MQKPNSPLLTSTWSAQVTHLSRPPPPCGDIQSGRPGCRKLDWLGLPVLAAMFGLALGGERLQAQTYNGIGLSDPFWSGGACGGVTAADAKLLAETGAGGGLGGQILFQENASGGTAALTFTSGTTRLYRLEQRADLATGEWLDNRLGSFFGDGALTLRAVSAPTGAQRFYPVVARLPLAP